MKHEAEDLRDKNETPLTTYIKTLDQKLQKPAPFNSFH
jgi:hypothetical protein